MRYVLKYSRGENVKFLGHLDLMRAIQRIIRRSEIDIEYSKGFNPHIQMSIAQPLSVGTISECEFMDIYLEGEIEEKELLKKLNNSSVPGIEFTFAKRIKNTQNEKKVPTAMAKIDAAKYEILIPYSDTRKVNEDFEDIASKKEFTITKKGKNGDKEVDIKPLIIEMKYEIISDDYIRVTVTSHSGSRENMSIKTFLDFIISNTQNVNKDKAAKIKRKVLYTLENKKYIELEKYFNSID